MTRFLFTVSVVLAVLKLAGVIDWPWLWVLAPALVVPALLALSVLVLAPLGFVSVRTKDGGQRRLFVREKKTARN